MIAASAGAESGDEPLDTLRLLRSGEVLGWAGINPSWKHAVFFAWNVVVARTGRIAVGDEVQIAVRPGSDAYLAARQAAT